MNVLGIFARHPTPGRAKTRLVPAVGAGPAAELAAAFVTDLADRFRRTADRRFLCYAPDDADALAWFRPLAAADYELWPQPDAVLGARLNAFFEQAFQTGAGRVVVIGSDSPTLPRDLVEQAFAELRSHDCVVGPATDGGYYLLGAAGASPPVFDGIDWSTSRVLAQTTARLAEHWLRTALLPPWYDIDTSDDLEMLHGHLAALRLAGGPLDAPHTAAALERIRRSV